MTNASEIGENSMIGIKPRYEMEEYCRLGKDKYDRIVKPRLTDADLGKICAIDIESGDYVLAIDELSAVRQLLALRPDSQPWLVCAGHDYLHRIGGASLRHVVAVKQ